MIKTGEEMGRRNKGLDRTRASGICKGCGRQSRVLETNLRCQVYAAFVTTASSPTVLTASNFSVPWYKPDLEGTP